MHLMLSNLKCFNMKLNMFFIIIMTTSFIYFILFFFLIYLFLFYLFFDVIWIFVWYYLVLMLFICKLFEIFLCDDDGNSFFLMKCISFFQFNWTVFMTFWQSTIFFILLFSWGYCKMDREIFIWFAADLRKYEMWCLLFPEAWQSV